MISKARVAISALFVAGGLASQSASAIPYTVTAWAPAGGAAVSISKTDSPTKNYNGSGGGFIMTNKTPGSVESFISWCVDIFQFIPGATAGEYTPDLGGMTLSSGVRTDLGRLATLALAAATAPGASNNSAAFQLAVWEIFYEHGTGGYNLGAGTFVSNSTASSPHTIAQGWLNTLNTNTNLVSTYSMNVYSSAGHQDQVTFTSVPEPTALGLLALGLIGVGIARRKAAKLAPNA